MSGDASFFVTDFLNDPIIDLGNRPRHCDLRVYSAWIARFFVRGEQKAVA